MFHLYRPLWYACFKSSLIITFLLYFLLLLQIYINQIKWVTSNWRVVFFSLSAGRRRIEFPACCPSVSPPLCIHLSIHLPTPLPLLHVSFPALAPYWPDGKHFTSWYCIIFCPYNKNNVYWKLESEWVCVCVYVCFYLSGYFSSHGWREYL